MRDEISKRFFKNASQLIKQPNLINKIDFWQRIYFGETNFTSNVVFFVLVVVFCLEKRVNFEHQKATKKCIKDKQKYDNIENEEQI